MRQISIRRCWSGLTIAGPALLLAALERGGGRDRCASARMLDLGCGTGLAGAAFRPYVDWLVGVDLSPRMIEQGAAKRASMTGSTSRDMQEFLDAEAGAGTHYHLIIAADVFVYVTDLAPVAVAAGARACARRAFSPSRSRPMPAKASCCGRLCATLTAPPMSAARLRSAGLRLASSRRTPRRARKRACRFRVWSPWRSTASTGVSRQPLNAPSDRSRTHNRLPTLLLPEPFPPGSRAAAGLRARISSNCWPRRAPGARCC